MTLTDTRTAGNYTHRSSVDSSNLREVLYDAETYRLFVVFQSGSVAGYGDVPYSEYERLVAADSDPNASVGKTYNMIFRQKRGWGSRPPYPGVIAPDAFVFRAPVVQEVEDVTTATEVNADGLAPWASNPKDEDVEVKSEGPRSKQRFVVEVEVEAESLTQVVERFNANGIAEIVSVTRL